MQASRSAYSRLREAIVQGQLRPNEPLREEEVAERLSVSRTPVREAIRRLHVEGLVEYGTGKTAHVADLTADDLVEVFAIRGALEPLALRRACERPIAPDVSTLRAVCERARAAVDHDNQEDLNALNSEFHAGLMRLSQSPRLISLIERLHDQSRRYRVLALYDKAEQRKSVEEHLEFLDLVAERQGEKAAALLQIHLQRPLHRMLPILRMGIGPGVGAGQIPLLGGVNGA